MLGRMIRLGGLWAVLAGLGFIAVPNAGHLLGVIPAPFSWPLWAVALLIGSSFTLAACDLSWTILRGRYPPPS